MAWHVMVMMLWLCLTMLGAADAVLDSPSCTGLQGTYFSQANGGSCLACPKGFYCPPTSDPIAQKLPCSRGYYQPLERQTSCIPCAAGYYQDKEGMEACIACNASMGVTSLSAGAASCPDCVPGEYYLNKTTKTCTYRGPPCNAATQYESPASYFSNGTLPRVCLPLSVCDTTYQAERKAFAKKMPSVQVRAAYISKYPTAYSNRECWTFKACQDGEYAFQSLVDDDEGFILKPLICKAFRKCIQNKEYTLLDGSEYGDRDYMCAKYTDCPKNGLEYQV